MAQSQTITGFFDNTAEAQQAVQALLGFGFRADHVAFSQQKDTDTAGKGEIPSSHERHTGRFLTSLFGHNSASGASPAGPGDGGERANQGLVTVVTVQAQSSTEVDQAVDLLKEASRVQIG